MYRYLVFFVNLWLISSEETPSKANKLINHTPVILTEKFGQYHYPNKAEITEDQNQNYFYSKKQDGRYFCPLDNNRDLEIDINNTKKTKFQYCLFKKKFKKGDTPKCKKEPQPLLVEKKTDNGHESCGSGYLYRFVYEICVERSPKEEIWSKIFFMNAKEEDVFSNVQQPPLYEVCFGDWGPDVFHKNGYRPLFTKHKLRSPYLLGNLNLYEENSLHQYADVLSKQTYGFERLEILKNHREAYDVQKAKENKAIEEAKNKPLKPGERPKNILRYTLEQLVSWNDFALGHWKKATLHMINYSPMNTIMVPVWRAINLHIFNRLIELYDKYGDVDIFTGTYDAAQENGKKIYLGDEKFGVTIPGIWWKLLYASNIKNSFDREGIVIVMHVTYRPTPICEESRTACDPRTWEIKLDPVLYRYLYCCKVQTAKKTISTIGQLKIKNLDEVKFMNLG